MGLAGHGPQPASNAARENYGYQVHVMILAYRAGSKRAGSFPGICDR
jgi:hypothetical protein